MGIEKFIVSFSGLFEESENYVFNAGTIFREIDEWSSLMGLSVIAMIDDEYNVIIKGDDIRKCQTIGDLFNIVESRLSRNE